MATQRHGGLSPRDVEHFITVLEERRRVKVATIEHLRRQAVDEAVEDETTIPIDPARDIERAEYAELARINEALRRIIEGKYGLCEDCTAPIGRDRLELLPTTSRCLECQERAEAA